MSGKKAQNDIFNRVEVDNGDGTSSFRIEGNIALGGIRTKLQDSQDLSLGEFNFVTTAGSDFSFEGLTIAVTDGSGNSVPIDEEINIIIDNDDANFDTVLLEENTLDINGDPTSSFAFFPDSGVPVFSSTDTQLRVKVSNNNLTGVVNMSLYTEGV